MSDATTKPKLGTRVRFDRAMAGYRVTKHHGYDQPQVKTNDPTCGRYIESDVRTKFRAERGTAKLPDGPAGTYRMVMEFTPTQHEGDLALEGIIVGKTFRYVGRVEYDEGYMMGVFDGSKTYGSAKRVPCWQVKRSLHERAILVPIDAIEVIG